MERAARVSNRSFPKGKRSLTVAARMGCFARGGAAPRIVVQNRFGMASMAGLHRAGGVSAAGAALVPIMFQSRFYGPDRAAAWRGAGQSQSKRHRRAMPKKYSAILMARRAAWP